MSERELLDAKEVADVAVIIIMAELEAVPLADEVAEPVELSVK
jgi:hypothetical protein